MTKSRLLLAALAAGFAFAAAGPASALTWSCTAKNLRGMSFTRSAIGIYTGPVHSRAKTKAMNACSSVSAVCVITNCTQH